MNLFCTSLFSYFAIKCIKKNNFLQAAFVKFQVQPKLTDVIVYDIKDIRLP